MTNRTCAIFFFLLALLAVAGCGEGNSNNAAAGGGSVTPPVTEIVLREDWSVHPQEGLEVGGQEMTGGPFVPAGWYPTCVPATVFAVLVENGVYPDPYYGMNLNQVPGSRPPFLDVSLLPMPPGSPFLKSWWYYTEFTLPASAAGKTAWLRFEGINFRANIWLNGRLLADAGEIAGTFREYELNVTDGLRVAETNRLALEVFSQTTHDLAYNWVDWNPTPPDKNMGIYREVKILLTGPVALRHPQVTSRLDVPGLGNADLTVAADLVNAADEPVTGRLKGRIRDSASELPAGGPTEKTGVERPGTDGSFSNGFGQSAATRMAGLDSGLPMTGSVATVGLRQQATARSAEITFEQTVTLAPGETRRVVFSPEAYQQLRIANPRVWWPAGLGPQSLYSLELAFETEGQVSDQTNLDFGIRDIAAPLTEEGYRLFRINGQNLLIRGGAWSPDLLLRSSPERLETEIRYARDLGLNTIRLEGKPEVDLFYDLCDRHGILVMAGWCCCDHWEFWDQWDGQDRLIAAASLQNQVFHLRNHPSSLVWLNGSDFSPPPDVEQMYIDVLEANHWPNPYLSSANDQSTPVTGPTGVKMVGPYDYVPPEYWLADTRYGGAFGFNTETSPGEAVPPLESLKKFLPPDHYWPIDRDWNYHAGRGYYTTVAPFTRAMNRRYGGAEGMEEYAFKSQVLAYDNHRAMFEAFGRNKYHATGVIQWMMNNGWPSLIWHLYDYYLRPAGAYFGAKKALETLHVQFSYDDRSVVVVNSTYRAFSGMSVTVRVFNLDMSERFSQTAAVAVPPDSSTRVLALPEIPGLSTTYFVRLELRSSEAAVVSRNDYWLSTRPVVFGWGLTFDERFTPVLQEADLRLLRTLPEVTLAAALLPGEETDGVYGLRIKTVRVTNPSSTLAFFVDLRLTQGTGGADVLPVYWDDNNICLLPGEERMLRCRYAPEDLHGQSPAVEVSGWNVARQMVE